MILCLLLVLSLPFTSFADRVEIASVTAHYAHPITNIIEDSGKNMAIGQGMTESVLGPQALIETNQEGKVYGTFRLHMIDQIESYKISVQSQPESPFASVAMTEMQRGSDWVDVRVQLPSKEVIIRIEAYITAMGRSVIFFGKTGDRVDGNTDFVVSVDPNSNEQSEGITSDNEEKKELETTENIIEEKIGETGTSTEQEAQDGAVHIVQEIDEYHGLLMRGDPRLGDSGAVDHLEDETVEASVSYGPVTIAAINSLFATIGVISVIAFMSGIGAVAYYFALRRTNDLQEAKLYGFEKKSL